MNEATRGLGKVRNLEAHHAYLLRLSDALRPLGTPGEIEAVASRILGEELGVNQVVYFDIRGDDYVVEQDYTNGAMSLVGRYPVASFGTRLLGLYRSGQYAVCHDVTNDAVLSDSDKAAYAAIEIGSFIGMPLIKNGQFVVGLSVHMRGPRRWTQDEIALVEETAERTWAVVERARAESALARSEEHYRLLFNSIEQGFCTIRISFDANNWPADFVFVQVNEAFERHSGLRGAAGRRVRELVPKLEAYWYEVYGKIALTGEPARFEQEAQPLGRVFEVYAFRIGDAQERLVGILFNDITERKRHDAQMVEIQRQLREADRRKDEFLATLAHELRNPLAPIRNGLNVLRVAKSNAEAVAQVQGMMERQVNHMVRLVDDLMEVSRITRGKVELRRSVVLLADVVLSAVETSRPLIEGASHELTITLAPEPLMVDVDAVRIAQVLANLLNNAAKYTEPGGHIWLTTRREGAEAVVSVRDNGMGIPADMLQSVFDLFAQADRTYERAQGGLGIGLTLVRSLVEMHGGSAVALSEGPGLGSEFLVRLPLVEVAHAGARDDAELPQERIAPRRILVVDDNADSTASLSVLLELLGAEVRTAPDGPAALALLPVFRPAVVLLDIGLPGMNGYEVARRMRALPAGRETVLVALTGWGQEEDRQHARAAGFDHHLVKPLELEALEEVLNALPG